RENDQRQAEMEIEFQRLYDNNQPIRAMEMLQEFSDKLLMHALDVSKDLLEVLFTKLTSKIGQEYRFHGA
ncbi:MAG: dipeptidase, partial [Bacteroidales bacterium]|nr:dipeptidase [Bacteroidales bacterium]